MYKLIFFLPATIMMGSFLWSMHRCSKMHDKRIADLRRADIKNRCKIRIEKDRALREV